MIRNADALHPYFLGAFRAAALRLSQKDSGEIAFIKLTTPSMEQNLDSILQRITLLEQKMQEMPDNLQKLASLAPAAGQAASSKTAVVETSPEPKTVSLPPAQYEDLMLMRKEWGRIASLSQLVGSIRLSLPKTSVEPAGEGCLCIVCTDEKYVGIINREPELKHLQEVVQEKYKKTLQFKVRLNHLLCRKERFMSVMRI